MKKTLTLLTLVIIITSCASNKYHSPKRMGSDACPNSKHKKLKSY